MPALGKRGAGLLIHVSSTMGRLTAPFNGIYSGSKWALEAMAESYRYEFKSTGVEVSIVQPGVFKTSILASTVTGAEPERATGYGLGRRPSGGGAGTETAEPGRGGGSARVAHGAGNGAAGRLTDRPARVLDRATG